MIISRHLIQQYLGSDLGSILHWKEKMIMAGLAIEKEEPVAPYFNRVVIGLVVSSEKHPSADRLRCCEADVGDGKLYPIVCGDLNVAIGDKVPVAMVGASLPGDVTIREANLRGVSSCGMFCSAEDLGILNILPSSLHGGVIKLPKDAVLGKDFRDYFYLDDTLLDIDIMPHRGDCLSALGIARECSAVLGISLRVPEMTQAPSHTQTESLALDASASFCQVYQLQQVASKNLPNTQTPLMIQLMLARCGLACIHPVVDVLNYTMLMLGQPLHAFDADVLTFPIHIREAHAGEHVLGFKDERIPLQDTDWVIADKNRVLALAGILGGKDSGVGKETTSFYIESAFFEPNQVSLSSRRLSLFTDAAIRFARGVDPALSTYALRFALMHLAEILGTDLHVGVHYQYQQIPKIKAPISLSQEKLDRYFGAVFPKETARAILNKLRFDFREDVQGFSVSAPTHRFDMTLDVDVIEELFRIHGYEHVPQRQMFFSPSSDPVWHKQWENFEAKQRLLNLLEDRGYSEIFTFSMIDNDCYQLITSDIKPIALENPLTQEWTTLRASLWGSLLETWSKNRKRQHKRARLFECARVFHGIEAFQQPYALAGLSAGPAFPEHWSHDTRKTDFYDIKGDVLTILKGLGIETTDVSFEPAKHPALHPARAAFAYHQGKQIALLGQVHPQVAQAFDSGEAYLFECYLDVLMPLKTQHFYKPLSRLPKSRRDLALLVDRHIPVQTLMRAIQTAVGDLLQDVWLFDVYEGEGIPQDKKSLAFALVLQNDLQTLTDKEIDKNIEACLDHLHRTLGAQLRIKPCLH